jgi:hypothetical protein
VRKPAGTYSNGQTKPLYKYAWKIGDESRRMPRTYVELLPSVDRGSKGLAKDMTEVLPGARESFVRGRPRTLAPLGSLEMPRI